jgi:N-acetylated-alpha-linked acidic dipeptidase
LSSAGRGTQYHSIYDDFYWHTYFVDKEFVYGRALSQTAGTAIMRRADADLIPVDYAPQALAIAICAAELEQLLKDKLSLCTDAEPPRARLPAGQAALGRL